MVRSFATPALICWARDKVLKIEKRRGEIFGYNAAPKVSVRVVTEDVISAESARLEAELAAAEAAERSPTENPGDR